MKRWIYSSFMLSILLTFNISFAQESSSTTAIIARVDKSNQQLLLRWAPMDSKSWVQATQYGYRLERHTVLKNESMLAQPKSVILATNILSAPMEAWEALADTDDYAAVIAEALFADDFDMSSGEGTIAEITAQSNELDQRFSLSVYAADNSFPAALMAGWAFKDQTIEKDEKYLYRLMPLNAEGIPTDTATVYIGYGDWEELPRPIGLAAQFADQSVTLSWNYRLLAPYYHSYRIEKSINGSSFEALEGPGITDISANDAGAQEIIYYLDSLSNNIDTNRYRIRGVNAFGELGPVSDTISGVGQPPFNYIPHIHKVAIQDGASVSLVWQMDEEAPALMAHYIVSQAAKETGPYTTIGQAAAEVNSFRIKNPTAGNYYKVAALSKSGILKSSQPYFYQAIDSIPPAPPVGLVAKIDSLGVVQLSWNKNAEPDMLGYRIYRAEHKQEIPQLLQDSVYEQNSFTDSVSIRNLNTKQYYAVAALDHRFNSSALSEVLEVSKPDLIPPVSPVIAGYRLDENSVYIAFIRSSSTDVVRHALLRKEGENDDWKLVKSYDNKLLPKDTIQDQTVMNNSRYTYTLVAYDAGNNRSAIGQELSVHTPTMPSMVSRVNFRAHVDREVRHIELSWKKDDTYKAYKLYRGRNETPPTLWKELGGTVVRIIDAQLIQNSLYRYGIRPVYQDGTLGQFEWLNVNF